MRTFRYTTLYEFGGFLKDESFVLMKNGFSECFEIQDKNRFCEIKSHIHQQNTQNLVHSYHKITNTELSTSVK